MGGDGLFQEVLDGVAALRCSGEAGRAAAAAQLRLGHIPGGSTDAVAYSLHGTRSAATAALHAALGDRYLLLLKLPNARYSLRGTFTAGTVTLHAALGDSVVCIACEHGL